ncbi:metalloregulator ArsR/SmtB family transcription factor [Vibrio aestuarianus]|uniref:Metalloregulator ArsR/SmtB family transcription factor n=2 Tax=Vibrio aestuarianus TaxID=28171 RepID=A0A7X6N772_9VIBR|nr:MULTISPECIES: metalloregulator ArsR/SmtB family transcription factor [Vibrio]MDE1230035.1 metalloregulator ArsR/SmtB family transcription factor [Vibrio aestuarianus]MDE1239526.1 metalloregulator ArsR/SmtB family transcription factor [Vibrio aestuarianus]MDE1242275.1 metalloregulator ArsR/SmtB family transcription factor [Vibrio aestuarianus]MDE1263662.1 metalloregulator ArsR/SmtB family transcription factor [Vibrio aestuarianus]MDE1295590.1 metalloregulator ArsR/SmtB family transcription f
MMDATSINIEQMKTNAIEVSELLKTLAHPERLMVLCQLINGEVGVGLLQQSSALSQSAFSQHLTVMRKHGIIQARKESQQVFYSLSDSRIAQLIQSLQTVFCN